MFADVASKQGMKPQQNKTMNILNLSSKKLAQAAQIKERMEELEGLLQSLSDESNPPAPSSSPAPAVQRQQPKTAGKRKRPSAAGIERIRAAQRARWAAYRKANGVQAKR